jgi:uncharacterized membrane protein/nitrite reductase/ring-hydroxylating ferredoxin subunit
MKSKVHIKSHPVHPILVSFPIAFYIGAFLFDGLGLLTGNAPFTTTGEYLNIAGVISAIIAAIPGFIDYLLVVPPKSSGSKRAATHGLLNASVLLLFIVVLWCRRSANPNMTLIVGLEALGVVLTAIAGWLGGTLVYRNQIGVDIRYAGAGKWKEQRFDNKKGTLKVAGADELKLNQMKLVHVGDKRIVVARTEDGYAAFDDHCTHRGGSLAGGSMICGTVQCPWHGSQFDVRTGTAKAGPAKDNIQTYTIQERDGAVFLVW